MIALRWIDGEDGAWYAIGKGGLLYLVLHNADGFTAAYREPHLRERIPQGIKSLGIASTVAECKWICDAHHRR